MIHLFHLLIIHPIYEKPDGKSIPKKAGLIYRPAANYFL
ncbi:hypothetical protein CHCC20335_1253 [Bacillus paralicheniformis]|nr:hypothetical protein CHCC20335_1253 [Bacillus paralicheniformis]